MAWFLGILTFLCAFIGVTTLGLFILSCVSSVINPQITVENGEVKEKNYNSRLMLLLITAVAWAIVIALP